MRRVGRIYLIYQNYEKFVPILHKYCMISTHHIIQNFYTIFHRWSVVHLPGKNLPVKEKLVNFFPKKNVA